MTYAYCSTKRQCTVQEFATKVRLTWIDSWIWKENRKIPVAIVRLAFATEEHSHGINTYSILNFILMVSRPGRETFARRWRGSRSEMGQVTQAITSAPQPYGMILPSYKAARVCQTSDTAKSTLSLSLIRQPCTYPPASQLSNVIRGIWKPF